MPNENFALSSVKKDQLKVLQNYLNENMIAAINTLDAPTLADKLVTK